MEQAHDFIVVGAGAAGTVLASRLADTPAAPSVLLLEAGASHWDAKYFSGAERFNVAFDPTNGLNWGYKTVPQTHLDGQEIDYSRGRGLGGSTAINFCAWTVGPRDDYDEWADLVGHERFGWRNVRKALRRIENLRTEIPDKSCDKYIHANIENHSTTGNVPLTYGDAWLPDIGDIFLAAKQMGHVVNPDINSGDPVGMGIATVCIADGVRSTSASAYLSRPPKNLTIVSEAPIARVLFQGKRAIGAEAIDGRNFFARKEVIVSGGALNSPQLLKLSGIGPKEELQKHGIPLIAELPQVGQNLQDHCFAFAGVVLEKDTTLPPGPLTQTPTPMGFFKLPAVTSSPEFQALPQRVKEHMHKPTVPAVEFAAHCLTDALNYTPAPSEFPFGSLLLLMNPQSKGTVTLQSSDPASAPLIDPKFLSHPFDRRVMIEGLRELKRIHGAPIYSSRLIKHLGPADDSDDAIWEWAKTHLLSSWHMSGTTAMGNNAEDAVVDRDFKVFGVQGLRVVDLGVCPFVINAHTQSVAYVVGEIAAECLAEEYGLGTVEIRGKSNVAKL